MRQIASSRVTPLGRLASFKTSSSMLGSFRLLDESDFGTLAIVDVLFIVDVRSGSVAVQKRPGLFCLDTGRNIV